MADGSIAASLFAPLAPKTTSPAGRSAFALQAGKDGGFASVLDDATAAIAPNVPTGATAAPNTGAKITASTKLDTATAAGGTVIAAITTTAPAPSAAPAPITPALVAPAAVSGSPATGMIPADTPGIPAAATVPQPTEAPGADGPDPIPAPRPAHAGIPGRPAHAGSPGKPAHAGPKTGGDTPPGQIVSAAVHAAHAEAGRPAGPKHPNGTTAPGDKSVPPLPAVSIGDPPIAPPQTTVNPVSPVAGSVPPVTPAEAAAVAQPSTVATVPPATVVASEPVADDMPPPADEATTSGDPPLPLPGSPAPVIASTISTTPTVPPDATSEPTETPVAASMPRPPGNGPGIPTTDGMTDGSAQQAKTKENPADRRATTATGSDAAPEGDEIRKPNPVALAALARTPAAERAMEAVTATRPAAGETPLPETAPARQETAGTPAAATRATPPPPFLNEVSAPVGSPAPGPNRTVPLVTTPTQATAPAPGPTANGPALVSAAVAAQPAPTASPAATVQPATIIAGEFSVNGAVADGGALLATMDGAEPDATLDRPEAPRPARPDISPGLAAKAADTSAPASTSRPAPALQPGAIIAPGQAPDAEPMTTFAPAEYPASPLPAPVVLARATEAATVLVQQTAATAVTAADAISDDEAAGEPALTSDTSAETDDGPVLPAPARPAAPETPGQALRPVFGVAAAAQAFAARLARPAESRENTAAGLTDFVQATSAGGGSTASAAATGTAPGQVGAQAMSLATLALPRLAAEITRHVAGGETRFQIRLDPAELGRVDVRIEFDEGGEARAHLTVERRDTLEMLARDQRGLERTLREAGFEARDGSVSLSLKQNGGDGERFAQNRQDRHGDNHQPGQEHRQPDDDETTARAVADKLYRPRSSAVLDVSV